MSRIPRAFWIVVAAALLLGVLQGVAWAYLAPGVPYKVLTDGRYGALPTTSTNYFLDVAIFVLSGVAIGAALAVGAWQSVRSRGWRMLVTLAASSLAGAVLAWWLGGLLAPGVDPASVGATDADTIVTSAPHTDTLLVVFVQPAVAAAVYTFLAAWNGRPDLGRVTPETAAPAVGTPRTDPSPGIPRG